MRASTTAVVALTATVLAACNSAFDEQSVSSADSTKGFSYIGTSVKKSLTASFPRELGKTWGWSTDNTLAAGWLLQMPLGEQYWGTNKLPVANDCDPSTAGCDEDFLLVSCTTDDDCGGAGSCKALQATVAHDGDAPRSLCIGHSDEILDQIYDVVSKAKQRVDITSLGPPDGRYEAAIRNALTFASASDSPPRVRMLFGNYPGQADWRSDGVLASLTRDVSPDSRMRVVVGSFRDGLSSWNHSKTISADGSDAIVGGMNLWTKHYLEADPVHDVSIRVHGSAAADTERYVNRLWDFACDNGGGAIDSSQVRTLSGDGACLPDYPATNSRDPNGGGSPIIAVGRLGAAGVETSDTALVALIDASRISVHIAQQDIGPPKELGIPIAPWPEAIFESLVKAMARGVNVRIVVSNEDAVPDDAYSNGWSPEDVAKTILATARKNPALWTSSKDLVGALCRQLHVTGIASSKAASWPDGGKLALHAKLVLVDGKAFYVGSQNLYVANLAEFGFIVDDEDAAGQMESNFYAKLWTYSSAGLQCPFSN